jgi:hypothetical protein
MPATKTGPDLDDRSGTRFVAAKFEAAVLFRR